ncbi:MAG: DUF1211 domain-containing protein [Candidatus Moraniibacteriota bacterium]|nr:MAG: DUF1211 domain-containing protein [Candidatus Moranbacteria bacterium]
MQNTQSRPGLTTARVEAFSDGVFAIAITLLVLGIAEPALESTELHSGTLFDTVVLLWPKILSFAIGFSVIGIFWMGHTIMFHYIVRADRLLIGFNTLLLMMVSFFPFPAALIGTYSEDLTAVVLYGTTLFLAGVFFSLIWWHATRHRRLIRQDLDPAIIALGRKVIRFASAGYGLAVLLAFIDPRWSLGLYILVPLAYILPGPVDRLIHFAEAEQRVH